MEVCQLPDSWNVQELRRSRSYELPGTALATSSSVFAQCPVAALCDAETAIFCHNQKPLTRQFCIAFLPEQYIALPEQHFCVLMSTRESVLAVPTTKQDRPPTRETRSTTVMGAHWVENER